MIFQSISILVLIFALFTTLPSCFCYSSFSNVENDFIQEGQHLRVRRNQAVSLCYDCADSNTQECTAKTPNCPMCMVIAPLNSSSLYNRRCCWSDCGRAFEVRQVNGRSTYFCTGDLCNGPNADSIFGPSGMTMTSATSTTTSITTTKIATTTTTTSGSTGPSTCYDCVATGTGECTSMTQNCPMCMVSRNEANPALFDRRCCWWGCGSAFQVGEFNGRPAYFCSGNGCNRPGSEAALGGPTITTTMSWITTAAVTTTITQTSGPSSCYDCAYSGGAQCTAITNNCPMCMIYRTQANANTFERQCCWWNCGPAFQISEYNGRPTYFCTGNLCNQVGSEAVFGVTITSTISSTSTITPSTTTMSPLPSTTSGPSTCYDCSDTAAGGCTTLVQNCPMCMITRNPANPTLYDRRCCWWGCGAAFQVSEFNGRPTYFCTGNGCNKPGNEAALGGPIVSTISTTTASTTTMRTASITVTTTPASTTTTTTKAAGPSSCYDCSGPQCGNNTNNLIQNCPTCMVYRNPTNPDTVERRCCWWNCGQLNSVTMYNGQETYFCNGDRCNGVATDGFLPPAPSRSSTTTVATAPMTTTGTCRLNCQNGGIPEKKNGCFCYCPENTTGLECGTIVCNKPDQDQDLCSEENEPLCGESDLFALSCVHLCGKC